MESFGKLMFWAALLAAGVFLQAYVVSVLWGWFMVTTFGLVPLSLPAAYGLALVVYAVAPKVYDTKKDERSETEKALYAIATVVFAPLFFLFVGYIVHLFMP